jgi:hypothetical protein
MRKTSLLLIVVGLVASLIPAPSAQACGGFFCTNVPVDQSAERIIFAVNDGAGTIDAYVQINYTGSPDKFAWVVPVPNPPTVDVADIKLINNLDLLTQPNYIAPPLPDDCQMPVMSAPAAGGSGVTVFGQGSVGPYDYAIVGSENPQELVQWLRTNAYQITPDMEPLVAVYVQEKMVFLAMKLQPQKEVKDIQPVKMTYKSTKPMIPLRLTAVAANPDMAVVTWILAKEQVEPENYGVMKIPDSEIVFSFGGNNYASLVSQTADKLGGRAFITEFAGRTKNLFSGDEDLNALLHQYPYLTRVYTRISPEEMTVDPVFKFNANLPDVSNVHNLSKDARVWDCTNFSNRAANPFEATLARVTGKSNMSITPIVIGGIVLLGLGFGVGWLMRRR